MIDVLAEHLNICPTLIEVNYHRVGVYSVGNKDYLVLTDEEAEERYWDYLVALANRSIKPSMRKYFRYCLWVQDMREVISRGEALSTDEIETTTTIEEETFYIYIL